MSEPVVVFDRVWKKFRRGERHDSLRDLVPALARRMFAGTHTDGVASGQEFWALEDVSFAVARGEALGIIGPNGAGKSTTLKLLTRILKPTRGHCAIRGRVGALIEVAAGFHPDLTGRENIFLQGAVMGMRRAEIARRLDEIIDFAGVHGFVDTPVKRYSSGMNARLGFSIAAHLYPDVLIIDEVLSVGDAAFQRRCLERMLHFRNMGVTVVFVSHDLQAISALCDRALFLQRTMRASGATSDVVSAYVAASSHTASDSHEGPVALVGSELIDQAGRALKTVGRGAALTVRATCRIDRPTPDLTFGFILYRSTDHLIVYEGNQTAHQIGFPSTEAGLHTVDFRFTANLVRGQYHIECYVLHTPTHQYLSRLQPAAMFTMIDDSTCRGIADVGLVARVHEPSFS